jgi:hypothetical protein
LPTSLEAAGACSGSSKGARPVYFSDQSPHPSEYASKFTDVGDQGCGYEAPLEVMYRFLVDPAPPLSVEHTDGKLLPQGLDEQLLELRSRFLAPYSQVIIVIVTDEDDCSMENAGDAWKLVSPEPLARGTSTCADSPTDPCCRSCASEEQAPPEGCTPIEEDATCREEATWDRVEDPLNLRCFDQRRRFGRSNLYPVSRYVDALSSPLIENRDGTMVENPLFASGRTKDMVTVMLIAGTPWQLLQDDEASQNGQLHLLPPGRFDSKGLWDLLLGPAGVRDAHLVQSVEPRPGLPLVGGVWDPISGHEVEWPSGADQDLQYSCIFDLPEEHTCDGSSEDCLCGSDASALPLCRTPGGDYDNVQRRAPAFPPTRLLQFARELGDQGLVGSICPRSVEETTWDLNYGFVSVFELLAESRYYYQAGDCFEPPLPVDERGIPRCHAIEGYADPIRCEDIGRVQPEPTAAARFLELLGNDEEATSSPELTLCEVPPFPGDAESMESPYYRCQNELHPDLTGPGYCYVDRRLGLGSDDLTTGCSGRLARRLRFIPLLYPFLPGPRMLICDYGPS